MSSFFGSGGGSKSTIDSLRDQLSGRQEPKSTMDEISGELSGMCPKLTYTQVRVLRKQSCPMNPNESQ
eukprot:SAG31_NODE_499_length_14841_cov_7.930471_12_plen_68_part_00